MHGTLFYAYVAFLFLLFISLLAISLLPKSKKRYSTSRNYNPRVLVILPCKGRDIELERNIKAAQSQDYTNYRLVAVIDSKNDPALGAISATKTDYILSSGKYSGSGKVAAIATALSRYPNYEIYVLLDSDVLVGKDWLGRLVAPLYDKRLGITTSYPVFLPVGGAWSKVKHAWGYVGFGLMENEITRFGWGGSLAFRKELVKGRSFDYFAASVSDDIAITNLSKAAGLKIGYVPEANPIVKSDDDFKSFEEWSTRQTAFSIAGNGRIFYYGIVFYSANILLLLSGLVLGVLVNPVFLIFLLPFVLGAIKVYRRSDGSLHVLAIYPLINFMYLANLIKGSRLGSVKWRGRSYDITQIRKTEIE